MRLIWPVVLLLALLLLLTGAAMALLGRGRAAPALAAIDSVAPIVEAVGAIDEASPRQPSPYPSLTAASAPAPTSSPPAPTALVASPTPLPLLGGDPAPPMEGDLVMRTFSLDFYRLPGGMEAATIRAMAMDVEQAIGVVTAKLGGGWLSGRVAVRFEPPQGGPCAIRGLTLSNERKIRLFYAPDTEPQRVVSVLAHELFHQFQHDYYGEPAHRRSDVILLEGMATWGSSAYFSDESGQPRYRARVREALGAGQLLPLTTSLVADCRTTTRNSMYDQWASFVEYLLLSYGREKLDAVYQDSTGRAAGSANYRRVYGKSLAELEQEWRRWLDSL